MAKFFRRSLAGLGLGVAAYMIINRKSPRAVYTDAKDYIQEVLDAADHLQQAREDFGEAQNNLGNEMTHASDVLNDIQTEVDKFQFKLEPHLAIMQKHADHLQQTLDQWTPKD
ncbi:hypothetical protein C5Z25_11590 [Lactobacillus sp. CBA3605]|uniref:hypothetical protein n=1 Tax=Lactobacillus sp. CBA3605 TaxID=2099788 RepID=UPI000CFDADA8|nr:hypothetical protein [Lactobacillus sp. CBA3605]AVK62359.1 hypothetical protein C5Z25_11590 [Lactobacillus sp. CBA3605]